MYGGTPLYFGCLYFVAGEVFFISLYSALKSILSIGLDFPLKSGKVTLSRSAFLDICNKTVSLIHSIIACIVGGVIVSSCYQDVMHQRNWLCDVYPWIFIAYLLYDTVSMYEVHNSKHEKMLNNKPLVHQVAHFLQSNPVMMVHHLLLPVILFPVVMYFRRGLGDFFVGCFLLVELSTPFVCLRAILSNLGYKHSWIYVVNGLIMIFTFACCRILIFLYMFWAFGFQHNKNIFQVMFSIPLPCKFGCIVMLLPQVYWLTILGNGAFKYFKKNPKVGDEKEE